MNRIKLISMLEQFFLEDIGDGDLSATTLFPCDAIGEMRFIAKEAGVFCGKDIIVEGFFAVFRSLLIDFLLEFFFYRQDFTLDKLFLTFVSIGMCFDVGSINEHRTRLDQILFEALAQDLIKDLFE